MWPFETGHTAKSGGEKKPQKPMRTFMLTYDATCWLFQDTQKARVKSRKELELAGEKARHNIDHLEKQLKHNCQARNVEIEHNAYTAISYLFKSKEFMT